MSVVVFAGAAQLAVIDLLRTDTPLVVVILTGVVVNLRMLMYSASLAPYFQQYRARWKALLAYFLTDQAYAVAVARYSEASVDTDTGADEQVDADAGVDRGETAGRDPSVDRRADGDCRGADGDGPGVTAEGAATDTATDPDGVDEGRDRFYLGVAVSIWAVWVCATAVGVGLGRGLPDTWGLDFAVPLVFLALLVPRLEDRSTTAAGVAAGAVALAATGLPYHLGLPVAAVVGVGVGLAAEGVRTS
jgi:predicted branched-subunit amino acid permease